MKYFRCPLCEREVRVVGFCENCKLICPYCNEEMIDIKDLDNIEGSIGKKKRGGRRGK